MTESLNDGLDLSPLSEYGVVVKRDGGISIDLVANPAWATSFQILSLALPSEDESILHDLKDRGFRNSDLAVLRGLEPVEKVRQRIEEKNSKRLMAIEPAARSNKAQKKSNRSLYETAVADMKAMRKAEQEQWTEKIRRKLDIQRQRILVSYALEKASTMAIYPDAELTEEQIDQDVDAVLRRADYVRNNK